MSIKEVEEVENTSQTIKCLTYTEHGSKNIPGSTHQVHLPNKVVRHYANSSLGKILLFCLIGHPLHFETTRESN